MRKQKIQATRRSDFKSCRTTAFLNWKRDIPYLGAKKNERIHLISGGELDDTIFQTVDPSALALSPSLKTALLKGIATRKMPWYGAKTPMFKSIQKELRATINQIKVIASRDHEEVQAEEIATQKRDFVGSANWQPSRTSTCL